MPGAPEPQASLCFAWKTEGLVTVCDTATSPSSGREGGKRTSGQLLCAPPSPKTHPDPHPQRLFSEDQVSFILTLPQNRLQGPHPSGTLSGPRPRLPAPGVEQRLLFTVL